MRLLVTADLHYNHPRSRPLAEKLIEEMNAAGGDVLLVVGDTAVADGDSLEQCLSKFRFPGPKLFVAGNHELWTHRADSYEIYQDELPRRVRALGWQWLETEPFGAGGVTIVGSVGWYDYSLAQPALEIPRRFYEHKISPGAAERLESFAALTRPDAGDVSQVARDVVARWNDGKFVHLGRSDEAFLDELLTRLRDQIEATAGRGTVIAAVHHLPYRELLPPSHGAQWDFAKAYLGSERIGALLSSFPSVSHVFCGHSHFPAKAQVGHVKAINVGSGYRAKRFETLNWGD